MLPGVLITVKGLTYQEYLWFSLSLPIVLQRIGRSKPEDWFPGTPFQGSIEYNFVCVTDAIHCVQLSLV